ncbi:MAG: glycosyltransferase [Chloroflexi bacterium]|nr:glycosyltransferase [Chloroflexota bacterium]
MLKLDIGELGAVLFYQFFARRFLPVSWFRLVDPAQIPRAKRRGRLHLHIVSHCWRYGHFLTYQLSSLVIHRTSRFDLTMTVYYSPEDEPTQEVLRLFGDIELPGITWDWQPLPKESLFRRGIGRNLTAKRSTADWIWFTDADVVFGEECLESLAETLQDRDDALVFPALTRATALLPEEDPVLRRGRMGPALTELPLQAFPYRLGPAKRAMGPYQIVHGDVARAFGYCESIRVYQKPAEHWRKCYEDSAFRWLLGTHGVGAILVWR